MIDRRAQQAFAWAVAIGLWLVLALHVFGDPRPPSGMWGVVGILALAPPTRFALIAIAAVLVLPPVGRRCAAAWLPPLRRAVSRLTVVPPWIWIGLLVGIAWTLRSRTLYGDAEIIIHELNRGQLIYYKEPLDRLIVALVFRGLHALFGVDARFAIALVNTSAGALFWGAMVRLARLRPLGPGAGWAVWLLVGTTGTIETFFGNIEKRALLAAGAAWVLVLAIETVLDRRRSMAPAAGALGLTFAVHLSAVWVVPSLVCAWYARHRHVLRRPRPPGALKAAVREAARGLELSLLPFTLVAFGMVLAGMSLAGFSPETFGGADGKMFVPMFTITTAYERFTMFSGAHLAAFANEMLLLAPVGLVLIIAATAACVWRRRYMDNAGRVVLAASIATVIYAFTFNPDMMVANPMFGTLNEWDLFSLAGVPLSLTGLWSLRMATDPGPTRDGALLSASVVSLVHVVPWILLNAGVRL